MNFLKIGVLGSGGVLPSKNRDLPCLYFKTLASNFLIDMGENSQRNILKKGLPFFVDFIIITHFHWDHFGGLFGYLNTMKLFQRKQNLRIYSPDSSYLKKVCSTFFGANFEQKFSFVDFADMISGIEFIEKDVILNFTKVKHSVLSYGVQVNSLRNKCYNKEKLEIFSEMQKKELFKKGELTKENKLYFLDEFVKEEQPYFNVYVSSDCLFDPSVFDRKNSLILHECTHCKPEDRSTSKEVLHTHISDFVDSDIVNLLQKNNNRLILYHFGPTVDPSIISTLKKKFSSPRIHYSLDGNLYYYNNKEQKLILEE